MSAFIVSNKHITAMIDFVIGEGVLRYFYNNDWNCFLGNNTHHQQLGQVLLEQNYASVNYRYDENNEVPKYEIDRSDRTYSPVEILTLCTSYDYQACETLNWKYTEAFAIVDAIRERAITQLPGWEEAAWTI